MKNKTFKKTSLEKPAIAGGTPVRRSFLVFGAPTIEKADIQEVISTLQSGWIGTGPKTIRFEELFRRYENARYAVSVSSCSAALHLSLLALGIREGDEVITTPLTFCATVNAILHAKARPVFADCDPLTMTLDPREVENKITRKTKAIIPVHFAGRPCEMNELMRIARRHHLKVVEDCAHAIEARYDGRPVGTFGAMGCFSFYVTKNLTTGEGGMILTEQRALETKLKILALHGMSKDAWKRFGDSGYRHYTIREIGFKYNMTDLQAALGLHQLARIESNWKKRRKIWNTYNEELQGLPCDLPAAPAMRTRHAYHLYTLLLRLEQLRVHRDFILDALTKEGIGVGVHYVALNRQPVYRPWLSRKDRFPHAEYISDRTLSIPLSPGLQEDDVHSVIQAVRKVLLYYKR